MSATNLTSRTGYNRFLLFVAGLGGLLYGVDVGIIAGALPYLQATSGLQPAQLSFVAAAVLLGSVFSTLVAGALADWVGRKTLMTLSGILFVISIPIIALAHGYGPLVFGRLLQGISGGFIGVVVPLYLAECLGAASRGRGTAIFQWLLTLGIVAAAFIGLYFSAQVDEVAKLGDPEKLFAVKDAAWRGIFWFSLPPGVLFVIGSFLVAESPRWLFRRGQTEAARAALLRSRTDEEAKVELQEMAETAAAEQSKTAGAQVKESLFHRRYVIPFVLACVILACNQATGVNSIILYNPTMLIQAGLSDSQAHLGYLIFTLVNFLVTILAVLLVDRKGRKFLLALGSAGIIVSLLYVGTLFHALEKQRVEVKAAVQELVTTNQTAVLVFNDASANLLAGQALGGRPATLEVIYSYGRFRAATQVVRSDDASAKPVEMTRDTCLPPNQVVAFFSNPFANLKSARTAPLRIEHAIITPVADARNGWKTAVGLFIFMAFFAVGPGVCVWLALSELMPTRIRSNGMSIALLINQAVSTTIATIFLPTVGQYGYGIMFYAFAGCTVIYFITAAFFLPETKGKTLEEIEAHFEGAQGK
jgi:MFS family permease